MADLAPDWLDELNFDVTQPWLQMGTRALGDQPWLIVDEKRDAELREKERLLAARHAEVFAVVDDESIGADWGDTATASAELLLLIRAELASLGLESPLLPLDLHPLDEAGRLVQEDLCLLRRRPSGSMGDGPIRWCLDAASLCFPSRWRLVEKLGLPMGAVHSPVPGYDPVLVDRVDRLLDSLMEGPAGRVVRRRNWFVHPDASLFQPERPASEPIIATENADADLIVRSERQTLRALPSGWIVFTIRIQQVPLGVALADPTRRAAFEMSMTAADSADLGHHGLSAEQVAVLAQNS